MSQHAAFPVCRSTFRRPLAALLAVALVAGPLPLQAASTTGLHTPQGGGATTANGDYISDTGGLDTSYRYFIEVPPGVGRLVVELFDADVGAGGTGEDDLGRDRQRGGGWDSTVAYRLFDPSGTAQTVRFSTGDSTGPAGADNAWLTLYRATGNDVRDNFGTSAYTNNDGNNNWTGSWIESDGGGGGATGGAIRITGGELRLQDGVSGTPNIQREADLLGSPGLDLTTAYLTFDYRTSGDLEGGDEISVEVSGNGGGSWTTLETFSDDSSGSRSYDITAFIANNTRVRFVFGGGYTGTEFFFADNLRITDGVKTAGHWELQVDMTAGGDDINAMGIRAHDGTSGAGGTEVPVYYDSHTQVGVNPAAGGTSNTRSYTLYPYITSGCSAAKNDFDFDSNSGTVGSASFSDRTGGFTQNYASSSLSANNSWRRDTFSGWTSDQLSAGYGIWTGTLTINTYNTPAINGNYANLWMSNFQAAANPPAANPTTNAFRVYLPNDAGTAPVKPYLEQLLTHQSGVNPVGVGQTSRYQVTVRLVNPTAQSITFSATNLVRTTVPGSGVVYAGNAAVSQGSITSQPAVGGTGNITWNPGTVAAGATVLLTYRVDVSPNSAGQRLPVAATPASGNGARATYVDETGNTTQARATYTLGPLCELAVTAGLLTEAVVSGFRASRADGGGVLLEWTTASEAGTAGFYAERWDRAARRWVPVHESLLASVQAAQGGTYRLVDEGASPLEPQKYRLVEIEGGGRKRVHGPFAAAVDWSRPDDPRETAAAYERQAHPTARQIQRVARPDAKALARPGGLARTNGVHLSVREPGLYYVSAADVAAWLGTTLEKAIQMIAEARITLSRGGQAVAWYPDLAGKTAQGLFFYGEATGSIYSAANVYRLQGDAKGLLMQTAPVGTGAAAGGTFPETLHTEVDAFPATVISPDPESDYWFWEFLQGDDPNFGQRTFTLEAPGVSSQGPIDTGVLTVTLHGATATGVTDEHQATVSVNGTELGETRWTGTTAHQASFEIPSGVLAASGNQVVMSARTGDGAPYSIFYVDGFDLSYPRLFQAVGDALAFTLGNNSQVAVTGFSNAGVRLLDVQNPLQPRWVTGAAVEPDGSGFRVRLAPTTASRYLAAAPAAFKTPEAVRPWSEPVLRSGFKQAEYLVVTTPALRDAAERLADLRRSQGLKALVVDLDQIMDGFNAGMPSPHALRSFLAWARLNWSLPPRYVVLAGEGTLDYRNLLGFGDNLVPPLMIQSAGGLFPSDNRLGDVNGDGVPEMAVGRIPVLSAAELDAYTAKIAAYESAPAPDWAGNVMMMADAPDQGADFGADSDLIAAQVPAGYAVESLHLATIPLAAARGQLIANLHRGTTFINYMGHGGLDRLSGGGLLVSGDVPGLANGSRLPVLTAMTCTVNRFAVPGVPALGELLVKSPSGGAAAVWGPSGLSDNGAARLLAERFYHSTVGERLGDRILRAVAEFRSLGGDPTLPRIYDLLGDPALKVPVPPSTASEPVGTGE